MRLIKNRLGFDGKIFIYQDKKMFNYSVDTILLGNFATINSRVSKVLDVGTNNGALAIFLAHRSDKIKIDAIEIQKRAIQIAKINVEENELSKQINVIHADFNKFWKKQLTDQKEKYDLIVCNPPFYKVGTGFARKGTNAIYNATFETKLSLEQLIKGASKILKQKGYLTIVEPTERLVDVFSLMRKYNFEPKRVQMIFPRINEKSNLVLVESRLHSGWGTSFLPNLYLHNEENSLSKYTPAIEKQYVPIKYEKGKSEDK